MATLHDIKARAELLSAKVEAGSITPEEVGGLIRDLALYAQGQERDGSTLGIRKVYPSMEALRADTAPTDSSGRELRRGNLVAIYDEATATTDTNSGLVFVYTGEGFAPVARIGTALRHENTSIESRLTTAESEITGLKSLQESARRELGDIIKEAMGKAEDALGRIEYTADEQAKVAVLNTDGVASSYLGADGAYHALPIRSVEVNGTVLTADASGKVSITTPQGTVRSFTLNGTKLTPTEEGDIALGLQLKADLLDSKRVKVSLLSAEGEELTSIELPQGGGGSGAGFLNLSREIPPSSGYYSLDGALVALRTLAPGADTRKGMIITIETAEGKWTDYRYVGTTTDDTAFYSAPLWQEYAKAVTDEHIQQLIESSDKTVDVAETLDDTLRPVASAAVKQAIDELRDITLDADVETTDEGSRVTLSRNGQQVTEFVVAGGGGGGATSSTKAVVTAKFFTPRIKLGDTVALSYGYTHYSDGEVDGVPATLELVLRRGVQLVATIPLGTIPSGTNATLDLSQYITSADSYSAMLTARYEEDGQPKERKAQALLSVMNLAIDLYNRSEIETYLSAGGYKDGDTANIILSVRGGARELTMLIDGEEASKEVRPLTGSGSRQTFAIPARTLSAGSHSVQFVASVDGLQSNSLYLDILKWGSDAPFVGLIISRPDGRLFASGETPTILAHQYEEIKWQYIALGKGAGGTAQLSLTTPSGSNIFATPRTYQASTARFTQRGTLDCRYELEGIVRAVKVQVEPTTLTGIGIKEGAAVELLALGRSNVEADPARWTSGKVSTHFAGVDWQSSGWHGDTLRLINGARAEVGYKPFAQDAKVKGLTITMEVKMTNVRQTDGAVVACMDTEAQSEGGFGGFVISPSRMQMPTGGRLEFRSETGEIITRDLGLDAPYTSGEYYSLTLVVHPASEEKTIRLYLNGVLSKADTYQDTLFAQRTPQGIVFDSTHADIELRHVRIYETALTDDEVLTNYITDRPTLAEMEALRERNDVLDEQMGDISWDKLYTRGKGVLNITMEGGGGIEVLWGKSTDTKTNYRITELIYRSPLGRAYDLRVTDAILRRQGTSTSTYPIKNLRIYLSRIAETKVYRNVGTDGADVWVEVPERTYVMRPGAKPLSIINLKADYADSSMMNNTEGAKLWDMLMRSIPSIQTEGMKRDPEARGAIDGIAISLFTSDTPEGQKRYCGQFQFNNDKSKSGYLFGQTKEDGTEIALEGINNTNAVANFRFSGDVAPQLARTDAEGFDASFEFLFPEKDYTWGTAPSDIKQSVVRLCTFIRDCTPSGVDLSRMTESKVQTAFRSHKFLSEVSQYFNVDNLCAWWVWTDYMMAVDQRVKNTFLRTWDGKLWSFTYYDGDTSWQMRNDAFLAYLYNITRDTWDAQRSKYAFEGHGSVLWALTIANLGDTIKRVATEMRRVLTDAVVRRGVNSPLVHYSEREYNKSGIYKYIKPTYTDYNGGGVMNYVFALNGTMQASKEDIIRRRFSLLDARYNPDDMVRRDNIPCYVGKDAVATEMVVHAGDEYYFGWGTQNGTIRQYERVPMAGSMTLSFPDAISQNDPVRIAGASRVSKLDLLTTAPYMQGSMNLNGCTMLSELIAPVPSGRGTQWYPLLGKISGLKRIDLTGQSGITGTEDEQARTFDVSSHSGLRELLLSGTGVRAVRIAGGSPLTRLELPATLSYLRLRALPELTMSGLVLADWASVRSLELAGCPQLDWRAILDKCTALERLRVEGVSFEDDGTLLERLTSVKGLDASGAAVDTCQLVGTCQLTRYIDDERIRQLRAHYPELAIRQPQYTVVEFDETVLAHANMSNLDNGTGYKFGSPYVMSAHIRKIIKGIHRVLGKQAQSGVMSVIRLHDDDSTKYSINGAHTTARDATVSGEQGDVWTAIPAFYYKGVNDILGKKKYAVYSTDPNPDTPEGRKITGSELRALETLRMQTYVHGNTLSECVKPMTQSSDFYGNCYPVVAKVPCAGWRYVYTPMSENFLGQGLVFLDAEGNKIKSVSLTPKTDYYLSGMNVLIEIPEGAVSFVTSYPSTHAPEAYIWMTNSDNPADWEPDWVYSRACLIATLPSVNKDGKLRSIFDESVSNVHHSDIFKTDRENAESRGGITVTDYERMKNMLNLMMVASGTRAPMKIEGSKGAHCPRILRDYLSVGMHQVEPDHTNNQLGYINRGGIRELTAWSVNNLGLVNLNNSVRQWLARTMPRAKYATERTSYVRYGADSPFGIWCGVNNRQAWTVHSGYRCQARYVTHGRYMDIFPIARNVNNSSYFAGQGYNIESNMDTAVDTSVAMFLYESRSNGGAYGELVRLNTSRYNENQSRGDWVGVRLLYDKEIVYVHDPDTYESIPNNF